jgi:hypothetical protein
MAPSTHFSVQKSVKESLTKMFDLFGKWKSFGMEGEGEAFPNEMILEETDN